MRRLALKTNIRALAPLVLPLSELAKCALDKTGGGYTPDFKRAFERFLIHTGGKAVIEVCLEADMTARVTMASDRMLTCMQALPAVM